MKKTILATALLSILLVQSYVTSVNAITPTCPLGDVKAEWVNGAYVYEYTNGSVTVSGDNRCVHWLASPDYNINGICIKYDGLIHNPPTANSGTWCTPDYDISHIVFESAPTLVEIFDLRVGLVNRQAVISWETGSEIDVVGFNIYRSNTATGTYYKRNSALIPPQDPGSVMGASYSWTDQTFLKCGTYYYKLEQVDISGQTSMHGPVRLEVMSDRWLPIDPIFLY